MEFSTKESIFDIISRFLEVYDYKIESTSMLKISLTREVLHKTITINDYRHHASTSLFTSADKKLNFIDC